MVYRKRSRNLVLSARPSLELIALLKCGQRQFPHTKILYQLTEYVFCKVATAWLCGIDNRSGGGILFRSFNRTFGLPRGAKEGLEELEDAS